MFRISWKRSFLGTAAVKASYLDFSMRQKFTGYERDGEMGLDFAQASMLAKTSTFNRVDGTVD
jgi:hypothetical protein